MATLTRSVLLTNGQPSNKGLVLPLSKFSSVAIFQNAEMRCIQLQKLKLTVTQDTGLQIGWESVKNYSESDMEIKHVVDFHQKSVELNKGLYHINEPEIWIPRSVSRDYDIWASLTFEALAAGLGFRRYRLMKEINSLLNSTFKAQLVELYKKNETFDSTFLQLMQNSEAKQRILDICKVLEEHPHAALGIKREDVSGMSESEIHSFQRTRPFWATDIDKLEELLQIPPDEVFVVLKGISSTWVQKSNSCWGAAEVLGYTVPKCWHFYAQSAKKPSNILSEVKPDVSSISDLRGGLASMKVN